MYSDLYSKSKSVVWIRILPKYSNGTQKVTLVTLTTPGEHTSVCFLVFFLVPHLWSGLLPFVRGESKGRDRLRLCVSEWSRTGLDQPNWVSPAHFFLFFVVLEKFRSTYS